MQIPEANPPIVSDLYETDFYAWTQEQAALLRSGQWSKLDRANLIEEIESLGKQQRQELRNRLSVLIGHLLKWHYQSLHRSRSWLSTIQIQRREVLQLLEENPSLKPYLTEGLMRAYKNAIALAVGETNLPPQTFPIDSPYTLEQILDDRFYPGEPSELVDELRS